VIYFSTSISSVAATALVIGQGTGDQNTTGIVPVSFSSDVPAVAAQFEVRFDDTQLVSGDALTGLLTVNNIVVSSQPTNGVLRIIIYSLNNSPLPNGLIVNLQFTASIVGQDGVLNLVPANAIVSDASGQSLTTTLTPGTFVISSAAAAKFSSISVQNSTSELQLTGTAGQVFALQATVNFLEWISLGTNAIPASGVLNFTDPTASAFKARFYRAVQQ